MYSDEILRRYATGRRDFRWADLRGAKLSGADLRGANLYGADLRWADLREANLRFVNLRFADLSRADLREAKYAITQVLFAKWGAVSDDLCLQLMRLDCDALPNGLERFRRWVEIGNCPFSGDGYQRLALFQERRDLWQQRGSWPPEQTWTLWEIWRQLALEKGVKISGEKG